MNSTTLFGSFNAKKTPLHAVDARVKIICLLAATVAIFAVKQPLLLVVMAAAVLGFAHLGGVTPKQLAAAVKPALFILLFSLICNMFVADGSADVLLVGQFGITWAGLLRGIIAVARILLLIALALVVTSTTSSTDIAEAFTSLLQPLARFGVPVADIAMTVSVALRFIPIAAEEFERIRDAQRARGVNFDEGKLTERLKRWLSVLTPLVVSLFRNADDLAKAMRERCYTGTGRTRFVKKLASRDIVILVVFIVACIVLCVL